MLAINSGAMVAAAVFVIAAGLIGWVVTRLGVLRRQAEQRAREAQIRLDLTNRLAGGEEPASVASAAEAIVGLSDSPCARCTSVTCRSWPAGPAIKPPVSTCASRSATSWSTAWGRSRRWRATTTQSWRHSSRRLAAAHDRVRLERESREARAAIQVGQSRAGLLSAVSHNLRTPPAPIRLAASTLRSPDVHLEPADRRDLLDTVVDETEWLERMVAGRDV